MKKTTMNKIGRSRRGATVLEYAMVVMLVFLVAYAGVKSVGEKANQQIETAAGKLGGGTPGTPSLP
jgi:Flp pilus assembly pilin Flp